MIISDRNDRQYCFLAKISRCLSNTFNYLLNVKANIGKINQLQINQEQGRDPFKFLVKDNFYVTINTAIAAQKSKNLV